MKALSYIIRKEVLVDSEYELLCNISGAWDAESSFVIKVSDIINCLKVTKEIDTGEEVVDCSGRRWIPDYDSDINFMTKIIKEAGDCAYIIVEFDYEI
jgi:hypothetical protein